MDKINVEMFLTAGATPKIYMDNFNVLLFILSSINLSIRYNINNIIIIFNGYIINAVPVKFIINVGRTCCSE